MSGNKHGVVNWFWPLCGTLRHQGISHTRTHTHIITHTLREGCVLHAFCCRRLSSQLFNYASDWINSAGDGLIQNITRFREKWSLILMMSCLKAKLWNAFLNSAGLPFSFLAKFNKLTLTSQQNSRQFEHTARGTKRFLLGTFIIFWNICELQFVFYTFKKGVHWALQKWLLKTKQGW